MAMDKEKKSTRDVVIIGSGPAGYTAAIYAARAGLSVLMLSGSRAEVGGQLMLTSEVENFPGFAQGIMGPELMGEMRKQANRFGVEIIDRMVEQVDLKVKPFSISTKDSDYLARSVIIATGAKAQWLGLENEKRLMGKGVSACATCDAFFFKDLSVVVVGGGDSAMEEALALAKFAKKVTVIHRRSKLRASQIMQQRVFGDPLIDFIWDSEVVDVLGQDRVDGLKLKNLKTEAVSTLAADGLFVAIGHKPATELFKGVININDKGYIEPHNQVLTNIEGVFAAGDVVDARYRQAITAAADGCKAALEAEKYLSGLQETIK